MQTQTERYRQTLAATGSLRSLASPGAASCQLVASLLAGIRPPMIERNHGDSFPGPLRTRRMAGPGSFLLAEPAWDSINEQRFLL